MLKRPCVWCGEPLTFVPLKGWRHPGGGLYVLYCRQCWWKGAPDHTPPVCPACGAAGLRDHHAALPDMGRQCDD